MFSFSGKIQGKFIPKIIIINKINTAIRELLIRFLVIPCDIFQKACYHINKILKSKHFGSESLLKFTSNVEEVKKFVKDSWSA